MFNVKNSKTNTEKREGLNLIKAWQIVHKSNETKHREQHIGLFNRWKDRI